MTIVPMPGKLLVRRISPPTVTEAGILLPKSEPQTERLQRGTVLAYGGPVRIDEHKNHILPVDAGDTVIFPYRAGEEFKVNGESLLLMDQSYVRAVEEAVA